MQRKTIPQKNTLVFLSVCIHTFVCAYLIQNIVHCSFTILSRDDFELEKVDGPNEKDADTTDTPGAPSTKKSTSMS